MLVAMHHFSLTRRESRDCSRFRDVDSHDITRLVFVIVLHRAPTGYHDECVAVALELLHYVSVCSDEMAHEIGLEKC